MADQHDSADMGHLSNHQLIGGHVLGEFEGWTGATIVPLRRPVNGIEIDPDVLHGFPVVRGTRIPYDAISSLAADGLQPDNIRYFYPSVDDVGVTGAVEFDHYVQAYLATA